MRKGGGQRGWMPRVNGASPILFPDFSFLIYSLPIPAIAYKG